MKLEPTPEQARAALDSLDDFARMEIGVDAIGARGMLERFINHAEQLQAELAAVYLELRKQRPAITAVFDRAVWDKAEQWSDVTSTGGMDPRNAPKQSPLAAFVTSSDEQRGAVYDRVIPQAIAAQLGDEVDVPKELLT